MRSHESTEPNCDVSHSLKIIQMELEIQKIGHLRQVQLLEARLKETEAKLEIEKVQHRANRHHPLAHPTTSVENVNESAQALQQRTDTMRKEEEVCSRTVSKETARTLEPLEAEPVIIDSLQEEYQTLHLKEAEPEKFAALQVAMWQQKLKELEAKKAQDALPQTVDGERNSMASQDDQ